MKEKMCDYELLQAVHNSPLLKHDKMKFYCLGNAFTHVQYNEIKLAHRLFYCMENHLPNNVTEFPAFNYVQNFGAFQQAFFHAVPDLKVW